MKNSYKFFKAKMPSSRKADYQLGCVDSSVFIDFNLSKDNLIYIVRISFDEFGCCNLTQKSIPLSIKDSELFLVEINKPILNQEVLANIVLEIINLNKHLIWNDALIKYNLINQSKPS